MKSDKPDKKQPETYDVIIVGAGPAGLTAGLYAVRSGMKTAIISHDIGGTANSILLLENWPGFHGTGTELIKGFYEQLKKYTIEFIMKDVKDISKEDDGFLVKTSSDELFENPKHPYTKALLKAIPVADLSLKGKKREVIKGEIMSPINPEAGCRFAPRCPDVMEKCFSSNVDLREISDDHFVACKLYE